MERRNVWNNYSVAYQQWHPEGIAINALHVAITLLQGLHPILRTTYYSVHQRWGQEVQNHPFSCEEIAAYASALSEQDAERQAKEFVDNWNQWSLLCGHPPWRILVVTVPGGIQPKALLVVHVHHIAVDGISVAQLDHEFRRGSDEVAKLFSL